MSYIILFALVLVAIWYAIMRTMKHQEEATKVIKALASEFGLSFDEGGVFSRTTLKGIFRGVSLNIYEESRYSALRNQTQTHTIYRVHLAHVDVPNGFTLHSEGISSKVGKLLGG